MEPMTSKITRRGALAAAAAAGLGVPAAGTAARAAQPALAIAAMIVLAGANLLLMPPYGVLGAAIVALATLFWLVACAIVLGCLRTDALSISVESWPIPASRRSS